MRASKLRWVPATGEAAAALAQFALAGGPESQLPDLGEMSTPLEKAQFLLDTAAEVEHALMVQYLYAAYSLRDNGDAGLSSDQKQSVGRWSRTLVRVAIEEMAHLMTVQNHLLFIKQRPNFEREDFPPPPGLYPFPLHLQPLTQRSLAKYVVAESPPNTAGIGDIVAQAKDKVGMMVNHVGILYAILGVVFTRQGELQHNEDQFGGWYKTVNDVAQALFATFPQQPPAEWHLPDEAFDPQSFDRQAGSEWNKQNARVDRVQTRAECLEALRKISLQGEGVSLPDGVDSHFEQFLKMYRGDGTTLPFPPEGDWLPTRPVPIDPVVDTNSSEDNAISEPMAALWAELSDVRYALILGLLQQYVYTSDQDGRKPIHQWCVYSGMGGLRDLSAKLVTLDRRAGAGGKAALPFTLPTVINLPEDDALRIDLLVRRLRMSIDLIDKLKKKGADDSLLDVLRAADEELIAKLMGKTPGGPPSGPRPPSGRTPQEEALLQLLAELQPRARARHAGIAVGGTSLRELFRSEDYESILEFLKTGKAVEPPFVGMKLVEPGRPNESAFYLHITEDDGAMIGFFDEQQVEVVRAWIASLSPKEIEELRSAEPSPRSEMLDLVRRKKLPGQNQHGAIPTAGGKTLSTLFREERYDEILDHLQAATAIVDPFTGMPLITPGKPRESAFYLHITDPNGAMVGKFNPSDTAIVARWIESLAAPSPPPHTAGKALSGSGIVRARARHVASGFEKPVCIAAMPGNNEQLFVAEQNGAIRAVDLTTGQISATPLLTIRDISTGGERGLLGLVFHPEFASNGTFYVNCTNRNGATEVRSYRIGTGDSAMQADEMSKQVILTIDQPFINHNGGWMAFGPRDGYLYIATGDGGSANDPDNHAQSLNSLLGKILRIDVRPNADGDAARYVVPPDNPLVGKPHAKSEIWAFGLRNPWRCSFDRQSGDLYLADVGQHAREEISFQPADSRGGENYGWRLREGTRDTGLDDMTGATLVDPIYEYGHDDGFAVIGGYVYRGSDHPELRGSYFFGDHNGRIWSFVYQPGRQVAPVEHTFELLDDPDLLEGLSTFGEDLRGELYMATMEGNLFQIGAPTPAASAAPLQSRWDRVARIRIHPAIGVARFGNAGSTDGVPSIPAREEDYFIGPELPFDTSSPAGGYKRHGRVRRQAARFRIYAFDAGDGLIGEITADDADITWTVELANKKASFHRFEGLNANVSFRNANVTDRASLEITPGPRSLRGRRQHAAFDNGSFTGWQNGQARQVNDIYLGEIQTDNDGRLIVLSGLGNAGSPWDVAPTHFANNDTWYDTASDGPVQATIRFKDGGRTLDALPAWVICAPPKFAPALRNVVTLYDLLFQMAVEQRWLSVPRRPSFRYDIFPILYRAIAARWLLDAAGPSHDSIVDRFPPASAADRRKVFERLRNPQRGSNGPKMNMPQLFDDRNRWSRQGDDGLAVTPSMYVMLEKWAAGDFDDDWSGVPPLPPTAITPAGLDQAALEHCAGGGFYPGIEVSWRVREVLKYVEPFRLDASQIQAGEISQQMAVPWQADFYECKSTSLGGPKVGWWPQQRPEHVYLAATGSQVGWLRNKVHNHQDMVERWHELGFVVQQGDQFVETERTPDP